MGWQTSRVTLVVGLASLACSSPAPPTPAPPPAAPQAVLAIESDVSPALAIGGYTPLIFDSRASTGEGLTFQLDFDDGNSSSSSLVTHVNSRRGKRTATLLVTDRLGRTDTTSLDYYVATLGQGNGTWWNHFTERGAVRLFLTNTGSTTTGSYNGPEQPFGVPWAIDGQLSGLRTVRLRVDGGRITFEGSLEWRSTSPPSWGQPGVHLLLTAHGGSLDGQTIAFRYADPY